MSETLFLAAVLLLLIGAMGLYFYSRIMYVDRKLNYIESILIDLRMKQEMERKLPSFMPMPPLPVKAPEPFESDDSEDIKDEKEFYNSVIESSAAEAPIEKEEEVAKDATNVVLPDYDSMTRDEVAAIAEKKSIRVTKRMNKATIINLLRESEKNASATIEIGKDGGAPLSMETDASNNVGAPVE